MRKLSLVMRISARSAPSCAARIGSRDAANSTSFACRAPHREQLAGEPLKYAPDLINIRRLRVVQFPHPRSAILSEHENALRGQVADRVPHGCAAHAVPVRELALNELHARRVLTECDRAPECSGKRGGVSIGLIRAHGGNTIHCGGPPDSLGGVQ